MKILRGPASLDPNYVGNLRRAFGINIVQIRFILVSSRVTRAGIWNAHRRFRRNRHRLSRDRVCCDHMGTTCKPRGFAPVESNVPVQVHLGPMDRVTSDSISNNLCFRTSHVATTWQPRVNHVALLRLSQTYRYKYTWAPWTE